MQYGKRFWSFFRHFGLQKYHHKCPLRHKIADYNAGRIPLEVKVHEDLARYYQLPFINLAEEVAKRIAHKEFTWVDDFKSLHPSPFGQEIYFATIKHLLQNNLVDKTIENMVTNKLRAPLQNDNYAKGKYVNIEKAGNKKEFQIETSWVPLDNAHTRVGFVNIPMLVSEKPGASFDFNFNGTAVGLALVAVVLMRASLTILLIVVNKRKWIFIPGGAKICIFHGMCCLVMI